MGNAISDPKWIADQVFTAADIATMNAWFAEPNHGPGEVAEHMRRCGFDAAPVRGDPVTRFVELRDIEAGRASSLLDLAKPLTTEFIIPAASGLHTTVRTLKRTSFVFLMDRRGVHAVVTRADLQKPPVAIVVLALILLTERALTGIIESHLGDAWERRLSEARLQKAREVLAQRRRDNVDISLLECAQFDDILRVIARSKELRTALGYPARDGFDEWGEQVGRVRNSLAHAGDLLDAEPDPVEAIDLFLQIAKFSVAAHQLVENGTEPAPGRQ